MDELIAARLGEINPLRTLGDQQRADLLAQGEVLEPSPGFRLFEQGETDDFNVYLLRGSVRTERVEGEPRRVTVPSESADYALGNLQPRPYAAIVEDAGTVLLRLPRARVEAAVAQGQVLSSEYPAMTVTDLGESAAVDGAWMFRVLQSALFRDMPTANIERFLALVERREYGVHEPVVRQGEPGDYFYMIAEGECEVMRNVSGLEFPIATLGPGDSFGEEALISGYPRNATVRTRGPAVLMRLTEQNFKALFQEPAIRSIGAAEARRLVRAGACELLDVRMESEHGARAVRNSRNIPLYRLRGETDALDSERPIVTYCDSGVRSKVGAFLLSQRGFDARYVDGGLSALIGGPL